MINLFCNINEALLAAVKPFTAAFFVFDVKCECLLKYIVFSNIYFANLAALNIKSI